MTDPGQKSLTHVDENGSAHMVDVSTKDMTHREAVASARVVMDPHTLHLITSGGIVKGDVFTTARLAGIMAAKRTWELIPLCHPLMIAAIDVSFTVEAPDTVMITGRVVVTDRTGVEMEALTAVSVAALTIYDMCKAVDRSMAILDVRLEEKLGGRSGHYIRQDS